MKHKITIAACIKAEIKKLEYKNTTYYQVRGTFAKNINERNGQSCLTKKEAVASWLLGFSIPDIAAILVDTVKEVDE